MVETHAEVITRLLCALARNGVSSMMLQQSGSSLPCKKPSGKKLLLTALTQLTYSFFLFRETGRASLLFYTPIAVARFATAELHVKAAEEEVVLSDSDSDLEILQQSIHHGHGHSTSKNPAAATKWQIIPTSSKRKGIVLFVLFVC